MPKAVISAITLGALLVIGALRVADLFWSRNDTLKAAEARAVTLTLILSEYLAGAFAAGDASLRQLALNSQRIGGPAAADAEWAPMLAAAGAGLPAIGSISVVDVAGTIRHSTRPDLVGQTRKDDFVTTQALLAGDDLIVGTPFRAVVEPRSYLFPIGRRLTRADGTIEGVVVASFIPEQLRGFFQRLKIGDHGRVSVFHPNGVVLFQEPSEANTIGQPAGASALFTAALQRGSGTLRAPIEPGGPDMVSAFHTASTPPLLVGVSLNRDEALTAWRHEAIVSASVFGVAALLLMATLVVLNRQVDAKAAAEQALEGAQQLEARRLRETNQELAATLEREQSARQEAENASALKDQFLMMVSHELRTPLTAIVGWARLLVAGMVSDAQKTAALQTIERNAQMQTRLIEDLLDVSGITRGKLRLDVRRVEIAEILTHAVDAAAPAAAAKTIRLEKTIDPAVGWVSGDTERLHQIVWNLLSNAVKFTPEGGRVAISALRAGDTVEISVRDSGVGIAPEFLPYVFDRFRQQSAGTSRRFGGLGLGLAIVRSLVGLHGGTVSVESEGEGKGATFTVRLPAPAVRDQAPRA